ncbi:MAG: HepT-like ribonuclease domain-containing protein, partial [Chloroflexota bacterium]
GPEPTLPRHRAARGARRLRRLTVSRRDPEVALRQMRDHAAEAIALVRGKTGTQVAADRVLTLALVRLLEVVGEAATRVPLDELAPHPGVPWSQVIGLRNCLGEQRCPECNRFCRALGLGGACPDCGQPVLLSDLLELEVERR